MMVDNLVENAARHGRADGRVLVTLTAGGGAVRRRRRAGRPCSRSAARIFEPFARVDGTGAPGSGLGLALVHQQARQHGATVSVGDAPLGGARFTVEF